MLLKRSSADISPNVELTPIIDMVFLLLIFFLVATTFQQTEREMSVALPDSRSAGPLTMSLRELVVNVMADGRMVVSGRDVQADDLRAIIASALKANAEQKVAIRADRAATYESVAQALDIVKGAGVHQPYLDTIPARGVSAGGT